MIINDPNDIRLGDTVKPRFKVIQFKKIYRKILTESNMRIKSHSDLKMEFCHLMTKQYVVLSNEIGSKWCVIGIKYNDMLTINKGIIPKQLLKKC